jgi:ATP-dependent Clp protease ATP-binding subunit ClpC
MSDEKPSRERFTDRARRALEMAQQEARRLNHEYVGPQHILLGVLKVPIGVGLSALKELGVDPDQVILTVESIALPGADIVSKHPLPETPRARKAIEFAVVEAQEMGHDYVGTEHLMLGLLRDQEGVAGQILMSFGLSLERFRTETSRLLN